MRLTRIIILTAFLTNAFGPMPMAHAQDIVLPKPGVMVHLSQPLNPPILKGIKVHPDNPFRFDFILDKGAAIDGDGDQNRLKNESTKLIKYFLASLTIPEGDLWVNLSPYEKDRIVPTSFGQTEMGRDLLAQDYLLKQVTASLIYPEDELGKKFWKRIYEEAQAKYGTTNIPVNTFNKVWIVPDKAVVYENSRVNRVGWEGKKEPGIDGPGHTAYVVESRLKVMLEVDCLSLEKNIVGAGPRPASFAKGANQREGAGLEPARTDVINQLGSQIVREIVIPALTREVNEGANFAQLRQVYNSLILATWYKKKIKESILAKVYADQNKIVGIGINDVGAGPRPALNRSGPGSWEGLGPSPTVLDVETIYAQYLTAFKKGVYNYIKEEVPASTEAGISRKYFSGGFTCITLAKDIQLASSIPNAAMLTPERAIRLTVNTQPVDMAQAVPTRKPGSLVSKPQRELNERTASLSAAVSLHLELEGLTSQLRTLSAIGKSLDAEELGSEMRVFLTSLREFYRQIPEEIEVPESYAGYSQLLKDARAERTERYDQLEKAYEAKDKEKLKELNLEVIRLNRRIMKLQVGIAGMLLTGKSKLKGEIPQQAAALAALVGASNSCVLLQDELMFRIGRLSASTRIRANETTDWFGRVIRSHRLGAFDIQLMPAAGEGQKPTVTIRQGRWINVHSRLRDIGTDIRQGRKTISLDKLDQLIEIFQTRYIPVSEGYIDIVASLKKFRALVDSVTEGVQPLGETRDEIGAQIESLIQSIRFPKQKIWVDVVYANLGAAFKSYIDTWSGYVEEIGTITYYRTTLEVAIIRLEGAVKTGNLGPRQSQMVMDNLEDAAAWTERGFVEPKQGSMINLNAALSDVRQSVFPEAIVELKKAIDQFNKRLDEIDQITKFSKQHAVPVYAAYRAEDTNSRVDEVSQDIEGGLFEQAKDKLQDIQELYFDQVFIEPGFKRAQKGLRLVAAELNKGIQTDEHKRKLKRYLTTIKADMTHPTYLRIVVTNEENQTRFVYVPPGTTVRGLLGIGRRNPKEVRVSLKAQGAKQSRDVDISELDKVRLGDVSSVKIQDAAMTHRLKDERIEDGPVTSTFHFDPVVEAQLQPEDRARLRRVVSVGYNMAIFDEMGAKVWGMNDEKRSLILPLIHPITIDGISWKSIKITGTLIPPMSPIEVLDKEIALQPGESLVMNQGTPSSVKLPPSPRGTDKYPERRFRNTQLLRDRGDFVNLPVGYGILDREFHYEFPRGTPQQVRVGYSVTLIPDKEPARLLRVINLIAGRAAKFLKEKKMDEYRMERQEYLTYIKQYVHLVRDMNQWAKHGNPNTGNISVTNQNVYLDDVEAFQPLEQYSLPADRLGYILRDMLSILSSIGDVIGMGAYKDRAYLRVEKGRDPMIDASSFFDDVREEVWTEFLRGYFRKTYQGDEVEAIQDPMIAPRLYREIRAILKQQTPLDQSKQWPLSLFKKEFSEVLEDRAMNGAAIKVPVIDSQEELRRMIPLFEQEDVPAVPLSEGTIIHSTEEFITHINGGLDFKGFMFRGVKGINSILDAMNTGTIRNLVSGSEVDWLEHPEVAFQYARGTSFLPRNERYSIVFAIKPEIVAKHSMTGEQGWNKTKDEVPLSEVSHVWIFVPIKLGKTTVRIYEVKLKGMKEDSAMSKGGIDFNSDKMNLQTRNEGGEIWFNLNPVQLQKLQNAPGFVPVIIKMEPMADLRGFLGLKQGSKGTSTLPAGTL